MTTIHKLKNGITILLSPKEGVDTACVMVGVSVGSNNEEENEHGLAHFFEHMCFKGTSTYPNPNDLASNMDNSGLYGNAFTSHENTVYYLMGRKGKIKEMIEITSDIFLNSLFDEKEMEKEKGVILEEISLYEDDPASKAGMEVVKLLLKGSVAEHHILGTPENVKSFSRNDFMSFMKKHYTSKNTTISISGNFDEKETLSLLDKIYSPVPTLEKTNRPEVKIKDTSQKYKTVVRKELNQTHIFVGWNCPSFVDKRRYSMLVLSSILGGSSSSRLYSNIRESLGLCYTVNSFTDLKSNYGLFSIYTAISPKNIAKAMEEISKECKIIKSEKVSEGELNKMKELILGFEALRRESAKNQAEMNMDEYSIAETVESYEDFKKNILSVSAEDIQKVASEILNTDRIAICYVSNEKVEDEINEKFLANID